MGQAGLTEMHLGVDHPRQHVQAAAIDRLAGFFGAERAQRGDAAVLDADVTDALAVLVDDGAALQNGVECAGHDVLGCPFCRDAARVLQSLVDQRPAA